ncbi:hypothetical protein H5T58_00890 [Candidatus Parcubacteria bacterium]|nr:hypothetical protein [Candidatus Parcubacteria bacterium]
MSFWMKMKEKIRSKFILIFLVLVIFWGSFLVLKTLQEKENVATKSLPFSVFFLKDGKIWKIDKDVSQPKQVVFEEKEIRNFDIDPTGKFLAYVAGEKEEQFVPEKLILYDLETGKKEPIVELKGDERFYKIRPLGMKEYEYDVNALKEVFSFSKTGKKLAFFYNEAINLYDIENRKITPINIISSDVKPDAFCSIDGAVPSFWISEDKIILEIVCYEGGITRILDLNTGVLSDKTLTGAYIGGTIIEGVVDEERYLAVKSYPDETDELLLKFFDQDLDKKLAEHQTISDAIFHPLSKKVFYAASEIEECCTENGEQPTFEIYETNLNGEFHKKITDDKKPSLKKTELEISKNGDFLLYVEKYLKSGEEKLALVILNLKTGEKIEIEGASLGKIKE